MYLEMVPNMCAIGYWSQQELSKIINQDDDEERGRDFNSGQHDQGCEYGVEQLCSCGVSASIQLPN